jgi:hypothetical protein
MKPILTLILLSFVLFQVNSQCTLNNSSAISSGYLSSTGNSTLDALIKSEKTKMEQFFNVSVDVKIYKGNNGLAKRTSVNNNYNGTIELGKDLMLFEYTKKGPVSKEPIGKYMIMAIMAHEFAHIFQFSHPEYRFKNGVVQEIHADMLAGYYMSQYFINNAGTDIRFDYEASRKISSLMSDMAVSFGWMGDTEYWSQQHHGNYHARAVSFQEPWRCLDGRPTRYSCRSFKEFLSTSVSNAEYQVETFDKD